MNTKTKSQLSPIQSSNPSIKDEKKGNEYTVGEAIVDQLEEIKIGIWEGNEHGGSSSVVRQNEALVIVSPRSPRSPAEEKTEETRIIFSKTNSPISITNKTSNKNSPFVKKDSFEQFKNYEEVTKKAKSFALESKMKLENYKAKQQ